MEHKCCNCALCHEKTAAPQLKESICLFPGLRLFYLPEAAKRAAAGLQEPALRLYHCRQGSLTIHSAQQKSCCVHAGEFAVWKEQSFLDGTLEPDESFSGLMLQVDLKRLTEQPPESLQGADLTGERLYDLYCTQELPLPLAAEGELSAIFAMLYDRPSPSAQAWRRVGVQALLLELGQQGQREEAQEELLSEQVKLVHEVHAYLTQNLDTRVTIEELSRRYLMNPTTLKQVFKSVYGTSLAAHMKEHRMGKAAQLLRETELPVAEIAHMVGYESQSKLTAAFKEYFDLTPKEYRKKS